MSNRRLRGTAATALTRLYAALTTRPVFFWAAIAITLLLLTLLLVLGIGLSRHPS